MFYLSFCQSLSLALCLTVSLSLFVSLSLSRELGDFEAAMESFQRALLLNQNHIQSLQLRGMMLYHHGSLQEAIGNFKVTVCVCVCG